MGQGQGKTPGPTAQNILQRSHSDNADPGALEKAMFAGGCFWGVELAYQRLPGVMKTSVGYTQGRVNRPTYEQVCSGSTGHTEALEVEYDPAQVTYRELCCVFWEKINPVQRNGQGNDHGTQYRSGIYYYTDEQRSVAEATKAEQQTKEVDEIATEILPAKQFYTAEAYHQQYLEKNGQSAEKGDVVPIRCYG